MSKVRNFVDLNVSALTNAIANSTAGLDSFVEVQSQLNTKAPLANPTFTGTVSGINKSMVGLSNVDNTSDANKPISTATQSALDLKANHETVTTISSAQTLTTPGIYYVTAASAFSITLPSAPAVNDVYRFIDIAGTWATNNVTLLSNSNKLLGTVQDLILNVAYSSISLIYSGSTNGWVKL